MCVRAELYFRSFFAPRADGDEEGGGVGGDGDGTEEANAADEGADDLGGDHVEVENVAEREIRLRGDEEDERERTADVGEDERVRHRAHDIAPDVHPRGDERLEFRLWREQFHLVLCGGDGDGDIHDGTECAEDDACKEQFAKVHILQVECLQHPRLLLVDACEIGEVDGEEGEQSRDEDAADRADDRAGRLYIASVHDELGRERDDGTDEDRPEEDVRGGEENESDQPLCDEEDSKEEDEQRLCAGCTAKEDEECGKAEQQKEHGGQTVVVHDGIALVFIAHDEIIALLRVDVERGVVQRPMCDRRLCARRRAGVDADLHLVLLAAGGECLDLVLRFGDTQHLCLVGRRIAVLPARQVKEGIEQSGKGEADGEKANEALRMDFHKDTFRCVQE